MRYRIEIFKNILSYGAIDILGLVIPIVTMPILTRALGPSQYGDFLLFLTILYLGHTVIDYGTQFTSVRNIARVRDKEDDISSIYSDTQGLRVLLCIVYWLVIVLYCFLFDLNNIILQVAIFGGLYLIGYVLTAAWFFQGVGRVEKLMFISLLAKVINLLIIIFFVNESEDIDIAVAASCLPTFIGGLYLTTMAHKRYRLALPKFSNVFISLQEGRDVFIGLLAPNLYNAIPTIALGTAYPSDQFVNFAIASRLASVVVTIQDVVAKAIYPILSRIKESQVNKLFIANGFVSIIPIMVLFFFGDWILTHFLGADFANVNQYLVIFTIGVFFIGLSNAISKGFLLPHGYDRLYRNISIRVSIISAVICSFGILFGGLVGGAVSITVARCVFFVDYYISYKRLTL
ncbi:oligosaccharide flippase family protein [Vibrio anguillarum]|uniref:oligosaccharide flippase family protein n=1 Tax=Vibrio anguillarum TaxID=55601 RepID=UPI00097E2F1F|nr:oligosaccharide flippase family protein [Vibrio anguillarum]MBT2948509.1 oligosaccharide flippase family protein [Vibrio anguillarum]